jgi:SAM-dependent methyltransferase
VAALHRGGKGLFAELWLACPDPAARAALAAACRATAAQARAPDWRRLAEGVAPGEPRHLELCAALWRLAVDLGCGTGLAAAALAPLAERALLGVDLSRAMLDLAARRGGGSAYARLDCAAAEEWLARPGTAAGLLFAADVLVYIGDLAPLLAGAAAAMRAELAVVEEEAAVGAAGAACAETEAAAAATQATAAADAAAPAEARGAAEASRPARAPHRPPPIFVFSTEALPPGGADYALTAAGRCAHARAYVERAAAAASLAIRAVERVVLRRNAGGDVEGDIFALALEEGDASSGRSAGVSAAGQQS